MPDLDRITEIRRRELAATDGPWMVERHEPTLSRLVVSEDHTLTVDLGYLGNSNQNDAVFVAHARTDVPFLLRALDQMTAERDELAQMVRTLERAPGINQNPDCPNTRAQQEQRKAVEL